MDGDEYYVYPVMEGTDWREHTPERPFCSDVSECPCHTDAGNLADLKEWYDEGLVTPEEVTIIWNGRTI